MGADSNSLAKAARAVLDTKPSSTVVLGSNAALASAQSQGLSMDIEQLLWA